MHNRSRNSLAFLASVFGTVLLVGGILDLLERDASGWLYIVGAAAAFGLAFAPGRRSGEGAHPPYA